MERPCSILKTRPRSTDVDELDRKIFGRPTDNILDAKDELEGKLASWIEARILELNSKFAIRRKKLPPPSSKKEAEDECKIPLYTANSRQTSRRMAPGLKSAIKKGKSPQEGALIPHDSG
jgi:hypothetical protein